MELKLEESTSIEDQYNDYIKQHTSNVQKGYDWLCTNLPEVIPAELRSQLDIRIAYHDASKRDDEEFMPYANYFYGEKSPEVEQQFNYAWLHHIHLNPHHWQHWMLQNDEDGLQLLEVPYLFIIEMICDWWAFSWDSGNLYEIFGWYDSHKGDIQLNEKSRNQVEKILIKIKNKLLFKNKLNEWIERNN